MTVKYAWISTPKTSSKGEIILTYLYIQQPGNLNNVGLQTHFNTHPHAKRGLGQTPTLHFLIRLWYHVKYAWISTLKASSKGEVVLIYLYIFIHSTVREPKQCGTLNTLKQWHQHIWQRELQHFQFKKLHIFKNKKDWKLHIKRKNKRKLDMTNMSCRLAEKKIIKTISMCWYATKLREE
jgi:hypothetical protein